ncbi:MAG TPA: right-handed parallel beta-helix repeat-containing protein, partial [Candidatus Cloacimonetes bacterium]|nr:right-handed parallel beta-helix repeat-containing protein [Candidatus Cloacimonadota bacterium]
MQKTKCLVMLIGVILLSFQIFATDHSGTISSNETWYVGGSPHHITGDLTVANGITLTIQAGCTVKFNGDYIFTIYGVLSANGTSGSHITITSNAGTPAAGDWDYIYFNGADAGCLLNYCDIRYGGLAYGNILMYNSGTNVVITNSTIEQSGTAGIYLNNSSSPTISDCIIQNNTTYGIYCNSTSSYPDISDCSILNNGSYAIATYANNVKDITGTMTISGNTYNSVYIYSATVYTGTWLDHNVPYVIGGNITVDNEDSLTIDPDCEIRFNGNYQLQIQGTLIADGTPSEHITFTSNLEPQNPG